MKYYRGSWIAIYVLANLIGAIIFGVSGEMDGDLIGYPLPSYSILLIATISVVASYLFWMGPVFNFMSSIRVKKLIVAGKHSIVAREGRIVGVFVLIVQLCFLLFNFSEGVNVAGSRLHSVSAIRYIWILLAPDALFLVYYGAFRKSSLFGSNLAIYLISNVVRGWLGTWLIIFFIEGAYRIREGRLNWKVIVIIIALFVPFVPILIELKWTIRELGAGGISGLDEAFSRLGTFVVHMDWWEAFSEAIRPIVMRFQHLANVVAIMDKQDMLSAGLANGEFSYFFEEGLPQYTIKKIFGLSVVPDIHIMLLTYLIPEQLQIDTITNTHVGLVGWFWISPFLLPLYIFYLLLLSWLGMWLAKKAGGGLLIDVMWFAWLGYLMNGWFGAYIEFMQALVILTCLRLYASRFIDTGAWRRHGIVPTS